MKLSNTSIPKSLEECYEEDSISKELWQWSEWLKSWGLKVLGLLIVIGIISTIGDAVQMADIDEDLVIYTVISSIISWGLYAFIEFCAYNVLALLIAALASIVQNSKIAANVALYSTSKDECSLNDEKESSDVQKKAEKETVQHSWLCHSCGKMRTKTPCPYCGNE